MKQKLCNLVKNIYIKLKNSKVFGKVINILLNILIILFSIILLISIYNTIQIKIFGNKYVNFFGYSVFEIQSDSMADEFYANDWIVVKITDKIELNDIVTFEQSGKFITHRVVEKYNDTYITQGDANPTKDDPIVKDQIVGKVVNVLSNFGALRKTIFDKQVLFFTIVLLAIINLLFSDKKWKILKHFQSAKKEDEIEEIDNSNIKETIEEIKEDNKAMEEIISNNEEEILANNEIEKDHECQTQISNKGQNIIVIDSEGNIKTTSVNINDKQEIISNNGYTEENDDLILPSKEENNDLILPSKEENVLATSPNIISVAADEISKTIDSIVPEKESAIKVDAEKKVTEVKEEIEEIKDETADDGLTLELLNKKAKKCKHIIEKIMYMEKEQLLEMINVFAFGDVLVNEATIKNELIDAYINCRYYNIYESTDNYSKSDNKKKKIENSLQIFANNLINNYKGNDKKYTDKVNKYLGIITLIFDIEWLIENTVDTNEKNIKCKELIKRHIKDDGKEDSQLLMDIKNIRRSYIKAINYLLKKIDTSVFELSLNKLNTNKNIFGVELKHNIKFSNVYSDYIIDETYSTGIIAEDKMVVLCNMLMIEIVGDMILSEFDKKYVLYIPNSLYKKSNKLLGVLRLIDDKYAKNAIIILLTLEDLLKNKKVVRNYRKKGYRFGIMLNSDGNVDDKAIKYINLADYVFFDSDDIDKNKFKNIIPDDLNNYIIYENIVDKVGELKERGDH